MKTAGVGENIVGGNLASPPANYEAAVHLVAERGWSYQQHAGSPEEERSIIAVWEKVNSEVPITNLRWCLDHVPGIDEDMVKRLKALGAGATIWGARYLAGTPSQPVWRRWS